MQIILKLSLAQPKLWFVQSVCMLIRYKLMEMFLGFILFERLSNV